MATLLAGRYRLDTQLGAGGSARVYRAHDERLGRDVAVKVLDEDVAESADPAARQRFEAESRLAATFVHPNAVTIFDAGSAEGHLFLVMELLTGGTLAQRLARTGPMDSAAVRRLGVQIGGALAAGHAAGIIHRDVKPSNILLADDDTAKLADFGIARRFDEVERSLTSTGMVMGTRSYLSPEQAAGRTLTPATDVFSLGVTLFEAATGARPRPAADRPAGDVIDPRQIVPGIDADLAAAITTACSIEIENRQPSMAAMVLALEPGPAAGAPTADGTATMPARLRPEPGSARFTPTGASDTVPPLPGRSASPTSPMVRGLAAERRRRRVILAVGAAAAVVVIGLVVLAWSRTSDTPDADVASPRSVPPTSPDADPTTASAAATDAASTTTLGPTTTVQPATTTSVPPASEQVGAAEFVATLNSDPDVAGRRGNDLVREFEKVLDADPTGRDRQISKLQDKIDKWQDKDEIDPATARVALALLEDLGAPTDDE